MSENERKINENQWNFGVFGKTGRAQGGATTGAFFVRGGSDSRLYFHPIRISRCNSYNLSICSDITSQDWLLILKVVRAVARSRGRAVRGAF